MAEAKALEQEFVQAETSMTVQETDEVLECAPSPWAVPMLRVSSSTSLNRQFRYNFLGDLHDGSLERVVAEAERLTDQELGESGQRSHMPVKDSPEVKEIDYSPTVKQHEWSETDLSRLTKVLMRRAVWSA